MCLGQLQEALPFDNKLPVTTFESLSPFPVVFWSPPVVMLYVVNRWANAAPSILTVPPVFLLDSNAIGTPSAICADI